MVYRDKCETEEELKIYDRFSTMDSIMEEFWSTFRQSCFPKMIYLSILALFTTGWVLNIIIAVFTMYGFYMNSCHDKYIEIILRKK